MLAERPVLYKNVLFITGTLLLLLGVGNWMIGDLWGKPYSEYLVEHPHTSTPGSSLRRFLLEPADEERERKDIAASKIEFYELVQTGGRLMILGGVLCLLGALATFQRRGGPSPP